MAGKKEKVNVIALEIDKYEAKVKEFQDYLEFNNILNKSFEEDKDKFKEMEMQMKIMTELPKWLQGLKLLKEDSATKGVDLRGGGTMPKLMGG